MNRFTAIAVGLLLLPATALAQDTSRLFSRPAVPSRETLDRLNLKLAWRVAVPTDGRRDGLFTVQFLGEQILVQTYSGGVIALNAADGTTLWRRPLGIPYRLSHALGYNANSIFAVRGTYLHVLERKTGQEQWAFDLPSTPAAAPAADEERIYVPLGTGRIAVHALPQQGGQKPEFLANFLTESLVEQPPLLTDESLVLAGNDGAFYITSKSQPRSPYRYQTGDNISAPLGQHVLLQENGQLAHMAYVASKDSSLYAVDILKGKFMWRSLVGGLVRQRPAVTDEDIFVAADRAGLYRINRQSGETVWTNREAARFLSTNKKYVYAIDQSGFLLILDRARGTQRARHDTRDFVVPIGNEWTDRLYLAGNDGLLICLHDRDYPTPLQTRTKLDKKPVKNDPGPEKDKAPEPPQGEGMDKPKDKAEDK